MTVFGVPTQSLGISKDKATLLLQSFVIQKMSGEGISRSCVNTGRALGGYLVWCRAEPQEQHDH